MNDYYSDKEDAGSNRADSKTALLPRSLIGQAKEGDTVSFVVGRTFEDEVEVSPVSKEAEEKEEAPMGEKSDMPMEEMDQTLSGLTA